MSRGAEGRDGPKWASKQRGKSARAPLLLPLPPLSCAGGDGEPRKTHLCGGWAGGGRGGREGEERERWL